MVTNNTSTKIYANKMKSGTTVTKLKQDIILNFQLLKQ